MIDTRKLQGRKLPVMSSQRALGAPASTALRRKPSSNDPEARRVIPLGIGAAVFLCVAVVTSCRNAPPADTTTAGGGGGGGGAGGGASGDGGQGGGGGDPVLASCDTPPSTSPDVLRDECGVFVRPDGDDATADGSMTKPFGTLHKAIELATSSKKSIFACVGAYMEADTLVVPGGLTVYGGLDCSAPKWVPSAGSKSELIGAPDFIAVRFKGGGAATWIDSFSIEAPPAASPGRSSIAALAEDSAIVKLSNVALMTGDGAPGAAGESAPAAPPLTPQPMPENAGADACSMGSTTSPGLMLMNDCGGGEASIGGAGGKGTVPVGQNGLDGFPDLMLPNAGNGGVGDMSCGSGGFGQDGAAGSPGAPGLGGKGLGALSITDGFVGVAGTEGSKGTIGQGGGGGGGRKGGVCGGGASGGAGGAGGCGGFGGKGGGGGGSSVELVSINATITLEGVTLTTGQGGPGGVGGDRQDGGIGSAGSPGGVGTGGLLSACKGGAGGNGGGGGTGGGGTGGHALGIAYSGVAPTGTFTVAMPLLPGPGAGGGNNGLDGNTGDPGIGMEMKEFPSP